MSTEAWGASPGRAAAGADSREQAVNRTLFYFACLPLPWDSTAPARRRLATSSDQAGLGLKAGTGRKVDLVTAAASRDLKKVQKKTLLLPRQQGRRNKSRVTLDIKNVGATSHHV